MPTLRPDDEPVDVTTKETFTHAEDHLKHFPTLVEEECHLHCMLPDHPEAQG